MSKLPQIKKLSLEISEKEYRDLPCYSYSVLSRFDREGFSAINKLYDTISTSSLTFGTLVDDLLSISESDFTSKYFISESKDPSDSIKKIVTMLFLIHKDTNYNIEDIPQEKILEAINSNFYYPNWNDATRIKKIINSGKEYYQYLQQSNNKTVVDPILYGDAIKCVEALNENVFTKKYFSTNIFSDTIEIHDQLKFVGTFSDKKVKCMIDKLYIDHTKKEITPIDIKTSSNPEWMFMNSYITYRYIIQSQLYTYILKQNLDKDPIFKDYKLNNFLFLVVSRYTLCPLIWEDTMCKSEIDFFYNTTSIQNWRKTLNELDFYLKKKPKVPLGIHTNKNNDIHKYIENQ